jgi:hypothetical protein
MNTNKHASKKRRTRFLIPSWSANPLCGVQQRCTTHTSSVSGHTLAGACETSEQHYSLGNAARRSPLGREASKALHPSLRRIGLKICINVQIVNDYLLASDPVATSIWKHCPKRFSPVLAQHSKSFSLIDCISVGVDRMQRSFEPMRKQVEAWQRSELTDVTAKVVIYEAFVEDKPGVAVFTVVGGLRT